MRDSIRVGIASARVCSRGCASEGVYQREHIREYTRERIHEKGCTRAG